MQIGSLAGLAASLAGQSLAERRNAEGNQAADNAASTRQTANQERAEASAGIGATDTQDQQPNDRDADGRQVLSRLPREDDEDQPDQDSEQQNQPPLRQSVDPDRKCGNSLDLLA